MLFAHCQRLLRALGGRKRKREAAACAETHVDRDVNEIDRRKHLPTIRLYTLNALYRQ